MSAAGDRKRWEDDAGAPVQRYRYRSGGVEFDEARFELTVDGVVVDVQRKPLQLLALLFAHAGEVVTKDLIVESLWDHRATPDEVIATAMSRLRTALGADHARAIVTVPRQGYRFDGPLERIVIGRRSGSQLALAADAAVPGRDNFILVRLIDSSLGVETWLARQPRTREQRVFKFAVDGEGLLHLKRELTMFRLLNETLGERTDLVRVLDWNFEHWPHWLECEDAGRSLTEWAAEPDGNGQRLASATADEKLTLFLQAAEAVAAAHGVGVVHKNLAPEHLLIDDRSGAAHLRLGGFRSSRLIDPGRLEALRITRLGMTAIQQPAAAGSTVYLAPELARGEAATARSDVHALGVILFQLLAGDLQRGLSPGWERDVDDPLLREDIALATDADPQRRLSSAAELARRLRTLTSRRLALETERADAERAERKRFERARAEARRPWIAATAIAVLLGSVACGALYRAWSKAEQSLEQRTRPGLTRP